ncbi:VOC family protein [Marinobacter salarius]|uniref:VOC family protein n=1 Tax=Marinobacter salarius TaxID=1420917 RepID=UPI0032EF8F6F
MQSRIAFTAFHIAFLILLGCLLGRSGAVAEELSPARLDHLVLTVPDARGVVESLEEVLGADFEYGGVHPRLGTENYLLAIGELVYLEVLAPRSGNPGLLPFAAALRGQGSPDLPAFAVSSDNIEALKERLEKLSINTAAITRSSRRTSSGALLEWKGMYILSEEYKGLVPFAIEWVANYHPTHSLVRVANLVSLNVTHPNPEGLRNIYDAIGLSVPVYFGPKAGVVARIAGRNDSEVLLIGSGAGFEVKE